MVIRHNGYIIHVVFLYPLANLVDELLLRFFDCFNSHIILNVLAIVRTNAAP